MRMLDRQAGNADVLVGIRTEAGGDAGVPGMISVGLSFRYGPKRTQTGWGTESVCSVRVRRPVAGLTRKT